VFGLGIAIERAEISPDGAFFASPRSPLVGSDRTPSREPIVVEGSPESAKVSRDSLCAPAGGGRTVHGACASAARLWDFSKERFAHCVLGQKLLPSISKLELLFAFFTFPPLPQPTRAAVKPRAFTLCTPRVTSPRAMFVTMRASLHAPHPSTSSARAPRSRDRATPNRKQLATCHSVSHVESGESALRIGTPGSSVPSTSAVLVTPRLPRRAALTLSALSALGFGIDARCEAKPIDMNPSAREAASLAKLAAAEPDGEIAVYAWDEAVRLAGVAADAGQPLPAETTAGWFAARADCLAGLRRWADAEKAYAEAAEALAEVVTSQIITSGTSAGVESHQTPLYARLAMAHDGRALAAGAIGDWKGSVEASRKATAAAGLGGLGGKDVDVPTTAFKAGLRGGAPTVSQRVEFDAAMARWGAGDPAGAAAALQRVDFGPEPDAGFPQFWEARAALAVALWASGAKPRAEAEWSRLCQPTKPNPPATPANGVKAAVNKAAQAQFEAYGMRMDKRCEDFESGTPLPCDDAGIPGSGGSSAPCGIFTRAEVENRLWPPAAARALEEFLKDGPEFVLRASEMDRGGR